MRASLLVLLAACSPYDDDFGETPFLCGANEPRCPDGYSCGMEAETGRAICIRGELEDFACADDSAREPNESTLEPTVTPIDSESTFELAGSAICPDGDVDTYSVSLAAVETIEALVTFETNGGTPLIARILNSGGVPIANASPVTEGSNTIGAVAADLDPGTYYVQVNAPDMAAVRTNNYGLTINVQ